MEGKEEIAERRATLPPWKETKPDLEVKGGSTRDEEEKVEDEEKEGEEEKGEDEVKEEGGKEEGQEDMEEVDTIAIQLMDSGEIGDEPEVKQERANSAILEFIPRNVMDTITEDDIDNHLPWRKNIDFATVMFIDMKSFLPFTTYTYSKYTVRYWR